MLRAFIFTSLALAAPLAAPLTVHASACTVSDAYLAGGWQHSAGSGFFEQIEFATEDSVKVFNSWLHDRPDVLGGRWSLSTSCILKIVDQRSDLPPFTYTVRARGKNNLELIEQDGSVAQYRRIKNAP